MRPTWLLWACVPSYQCIMHQPTRVWFELLAALGSWLACGALGHRPDRCPGTGWLAGSDRLSELESSSAFLWLTGSCGDSQEDRASLLAPLRHSRAKALNISLGGCKGLLLAICHWFHSSIKNPPNQSLNATFMFLGL